MIMVMIVTTVTVMISFVSFRKGRVVVHSVRHFSFRVEGRLLYRGFSCRACFYGNAQKVTTV